MKVLYFARARELAGTKIEDTDEFDGLTVAEVLAELSLRFGPEFATLVERSTIMVDDSIVTSDRYDEHSVGGELAILPPVSGGDGPVGDRHYHSEHGPSTGPLRVAILTVSDRASAGEYQDLTGPALAELIESRIDAKVITTAVVADSRDSIAATVSGWCDDDLGDNGGPAQLVITNGGTGLSDRDVTPEAIRTVLDVEAPGLGEVMRAAGLAKTPLASLSRQTAGRRKATIVVCVPGSVKAAIESVEAIADVLPHACSLAAQVTSVEPSTESSAKVGS